MRAEISHTGSMRVTGRAVSESMPAAPRRRAVTYVDYGRPPRGRSLSSGLAALAAAFLFLLMLRTGIL